MCVTKKDPLSRAPKFNETEIPSNTNVFKDILHYQCSVVKHCIIRIRRVKQNHTESRKDRAGSPYPRAEADGREGALRLFLKFISSQQASLQKFIDMATLIQHSMDVNMIVGNISLINKAVHADMDFAEV
jgi:hypothetical protein